MYCTPIQLKNNWCPRLLAVPVISFPVVVNKCLKKQVQECFAVHLIYTPKVTDKSFMMKQNSFLFKLKADGHKKEWKVYKNVSSINKFAWKISMVDKVSWLKCRVAILYLLCQFHQAFNSDIPLNQLQLFKFSISCYCFTTSF